MGQNTRMPNLIIGGVFKAATTSLFAYLTLHPDICGSSRKETRYFTLLANGDNAMTREEYTGYFNACGDVRYLLEASPDYFYGKADVARIMHDMLPDDTKIIFLLREPVERSISHFRHEKKFMTMDKDVSIDDYVRGWRASVEYDDYFFPLEGSHYVNYLPPWFEIFGDRVRVYFFDQMRDERDAVLHDIAAWLDIDPALFPYDQMHVENVTTGYKNALMQRVALAVNRQGEAFWRSNPGLKRGLKRVYTMINGEKATDKPEDEQTDLLRDAYTESNRALAALLRERGYTNLPTWLAHT
ncbi:sulfotransferase [bacterium]|nr:sulfotransferase [bacterium]